MLQYSLKMHDFSLFKVKSVSAKAGMKEEGNMAVRQQPSWRAICFQGNYLRHFRLIRNSGVSRRSGHGSRGGQAAGDHAVGALFQDTGAFAEVRVEKDLNRNGRLVMAEKAKQSARQTEPSETSAP
jgi:hypothetical protein